MAEERLILSKILPFLSQRTQKQNQPYPPLYWDLFGVFVVGLLCRPKEAKFWIALPLVGYGFAWVGHAFFEKNKPATFKYPCGTFEVTLNSFEILFGKRGFDASRD